VTNGVKVDYGNGFTLDDGTVLTGQATATYSNVVITSTKISGTVTLALNNYTKNGGYATVTNITSSVNVNVSAQGKLTGDVTIKRERAPPRRGQRR